MLRRLFYRPLYILFTETHWLFCDDRPRLRHDIKVLMAARQLGRYDSKFHPGLYEVRWKLVGRRPMLVFLPIRK